MPKPETLLSPEQFQDFLLQDVWGIEARINWLFVLAHSVSSLDLQPSLKSDTYYIAVMPIHVYLQLSDPMEEVRSVSP